MEDKWPPHGQPPPPQVPTEDQVLGAALEDISRWVWAKGCGQRSVGSKVWAAGCGVWAAECGQAGLGWGQRVFRQVWGMRLHACVQFHFPTLLTLSHCPQERGGGAPTENMPILCALECLLFIAVCLMT